MEFTQKELIAFLLNLLRAGVILAIGLLLARVVRGWILRLATRRRMAVNLVTLLGNLAQVAIVVFALIMILPTFGVDWTGLLTVIGTIGLAVSLAFQDLLKNFIAGIYILIERPFQIGDVITVERPGATVTGTVQSIELRITTLRTGDGPQVIVPNGMLFTEVVTNRSAFNLQRHVVSVTTSLGADRLSDITDRLDKAVATVKGVVSSPAASTRVESITAQTVKLDVEFWTPPALEHQIDGAVALALREAVPEAEVTVVN